MCSKPLVFGTLTFSFHQLHCFMGSHVTSKAPVGFNRLCDLWRLLGWLKGNPVGVCWCPFPPLSFWRATLVWLMVALGWFFYERFKRFPATTAKAKVVSNMHKITVSWKIPTPGHCNHSRGLVQRLLCTVGVWHVQLTPLPEPSPYLSEGARWAFLPSSRAENQGIDLSWLWVSSYVRIFVCV